MSPRALMNAHENQSAVRTYECSERNHEGPIHCVTPISEGPPSGPGPLTLAHDNAARGKANRRRVAPGRWGPGEHLGNSLLKVYLAGRARNLANFSPRAGPAISLGDCAKCTSCPARCCQSRGRTRQLGPQRAALRAAQP